MSNREENLRDERIKKLKILESRGIEAYAIKTSDSRRLIRDVLLDFDNIDLNSSNELSLDKLCVIAGRVRSVRRHGKIIFVDIADESGKMQSVFKEDKIGIEEFEGLFEIVDEGDFIEVSGNLIITKTGEKSILANGWHMLSKSLRPIPSEYYGLKDIEERLRKRYLDLVSNKETSEIFRKKSIFWKSIRDYMLNEGFLEVETPVLESTPGGAEAEPFITHHNALDRDYFLRISLELPLKRLLVGGYEKVFEIGRIFRNEGIDAEHLQDYTQLEFYWAYSDYENLMVLLQKMYKSVIQNTIGSLEHSYNCQLIDWSKDWPVNDFYDLFEKNVGISPDSSEEELKKLAIKNGLDISQVFGIGRLQDLLYKKLVRPKLVEPQFLIRPPVTMEPLAKRDTEFPNRVQRLQILAGGTELGKGFSELNDPIDQLERFQEQEKARKAGDKEAQMLDSDYIEALEYGMPPASGFGMSERLFAFLLDRPIRETVIFPSMREK